MIKILKSQKGFSLIEALLGLIFAALIGLIGINVANNHKNKTSSVVINAASETSKMVKDPTVNWTAESNLIGKFDVKYPGSWATVIYPKACTDTAENGVFFLGANMDSVGKCATENLGQMSIIWTTDNQLCADLDSSTWTQNSKQTVAVSNVKAFKIQATAKESGNLLGGYPAGTKTVQYCAVSNSKVKYIASYVQLATYPDVLNEFNTMVTKTLKFN